MKTPLVLLLGFLVPFALARCQSTYRPTDWFGWQPLNDQTCIGWVLDSNYSCAIGNFSIPTQTPNTPYVHLGVGSNCRSDESGPCLPQPLNGLSDGITQIGPMFQSPTLSYENASECRLVVQMSNGFERAFVQNQAVIYGIWISNIQVQSGAIPAWTWFDEIFSQPPENIRFQYVNNYGYSTAATLFAFRDLRLRCEGFIIGPNISTECWTEESPMPSTTSAAAASEVSEQPFITQSRLAPPSVSSGSAIDSCNSLFLILASIWILAIMTYTDISVHFILAVMLTFVVLLFYKFLRFSGPTD